MTDLEKIKSLAAKGKVSRREFVQIALAAGLTVAAAETMFVKAVRASAEEGRFRAHRPGAWRDDRLARSRHLSRTLGRRCRFWGTLSNSLTEVDAKGNVISDLAESMEPVDDAKTWVFKLRKGLTFHNGKT